jgi:succinate dehydrogenase flavin-adding protein (antitoxin of CptAB toxin-antitoxin module)
MRELDALLVGFLDEVYPTLRPADKSRFAGLLQLPDTELEAYLLGQGTAPDPDDARLIAAIQRSFRPPS